MSDQNFIEDNILIISKQTMDLFLKQKNPADVIALYCFYYYTAKWQKTNQIKCTTGYAAKGLNKSEDVIRRTKKVLNEIGLIEDLKVKGNNNKITGWYIKINYVWKKETVKKIHPTDFPEGGKTLKSHPQVFPQGGESHSVEKPDTNALSANILNALSANKENPLSPNTEKEGARKVKKSKTKEFIPPTDDQVQEYIFKNDLNVNVKSFMKYYRASEWHHNDGRKVCNWKLCAVSWSNLEDEKKNKNKPYADLPDKPLPTQKEIDDFYKTY